MSAEVPKLHHRIPLGEPGPVGDRPPAEVIVLLVDPAAVHSLPPATYMGGDPSFDQRSIAFGALGRFEYV